jgi:hypothetical protein
MLLARRPAQPHLGAATKEGPMAAEENKPTLITHEQAAAAAKALLGGRPGTTTKVGPLYITTLGNAPAGKPDPAGATAYLAKLRGAR